MWSRRSQIGMGLGSARGRHPNWSHPDHDACGTGFVTCLGGAPSYEIIQISLTALERLTHRGGVDADGASGDGAGLLTSLPQKFFRERTRELAIGLPEHFGVGCAFLPGSATAEFRAAIEIAADTGRLRVLGWRRVPVNVNALGRKALETMPEIWQFFVAASDASQEGEGFERRLMLLRKRAESLMPPRCYLSSLSSNHRLQGIADTVAVSAVLRGFARSFLCRGLRGFSPAVFYKHAAFLAPSPAFPLRGPQRRDQHHRLEPAVAARQGTGDQGTAQGRALVFDFGRQRQRLREFRQRD